MAPPLHQLPLPIGSISRSSRSATPGAKERERLVLQVKASGTRLTTSPLLESQSLLGILAFMRSQELRATCVDWDAAVSIRAPADSTTNNNSAASAMCNSFPLPALLTLVSYSAARGGEHIEVLSYKLMDSAAHSTNISPRGVLPAGSGFG